ncbi:hypothetical protein RQP46_010317 [Phenoliferia psychrophenolica]
MTAQRRVPLCDFNLDKPSAHPSGPTPSVPIFTPPDFTIKDLLDAIPAHCFERSGFRSSLYLVVDLVAIATLVWAASWIDIVFGSEGVWISGSLGVLAKWTAWSTYWFTNGLVMTGVWVIAHECGHQAFSTSKALNNAVGLVFHSLLLVPYHSWRISHAKHHAGAGHLTRDEVFIPDTREFVVGNRHGKSGRIVTVGGIELEELVDDTPIYRLGWLIAQQLLGWPLYLIKNASGQRSYPAWTNHFNPSAIIFDARHRRDVLISNVALLCTIGLLHVVRMQFGWSGFAKYYFVPYLWVNHWLVMHTDQTIPHYGPDEWTFARGALSTMDRNLLGPIGPYILHGICETHVVHHIHSKIPHCESTPSWEATEAIKKLLGPHYLCSNENMFRSLFSVFRSCRFVEEGDQVAFYKDAYGTMQRDVKVGAADSGVDVGSSPEPEEL